MSPPVLAGDVWKLLATQMGGYRLVLRMTCIRLRDLFPAPTREDIQGLLWEMCARSDVHLIRWWCFTMPTCVSGLNGCRDIMAIAGNVPIMRWAMVVGRFQWEPTLTQTAARAGNCALLDMALGCPNTWMYLSILVTYGNPDVIRWARERHLAYELMGAAGYNTPGRIRPIWDHRDAVHAAYGDHAMLDLLAEWAPEEEVEPVDIDVYANEDP